MATVDDLQKDHEARLAPLLAEIGGRGADSNLAADLKAIEFCALATFLGEMIAHAHQLLHGGDKNAPAHHDVVH